MQFRFADFLVNGAISGNNITVTVPNIVNLTTLSPTITHNGKSISPASGVEQDFTNPIHYTVTAEDNTTKNYTVTVTVTNTTLDRAFAWINSHGIIGHTYTIVAQANESLAPITIANLSINIILSGGATERTISLRSNGSLFTVTLLGTLTLENNITLSGHTTNNASLVKLDSGSLVMKAGSKIQNNTVTINDGNAFGGGVYIENFGTFTMDGGTISGNKVEAKSSSSSFDNTTTSVKVAGGGVYLSSGSFSMNGGTISSNTAYSEKFNTAGGGVYVNNDNYSGTFTMSGGTISGNTAESKAALTSPYAYGGGVAVWNNATFTMTGGTISENTAKSSMTIGTTYAQGGGVYVRSRNFTKTGGTIYGSNASPTTLQNTAKNTDSGHAVYALVSSTILKRNTTAGTTVNMDSNTTGSAGGWE
jgi:hypothetical protein